MTYFWIKLIDLDGAKSWILGLNFNLEKPQKCVDLTVQEGPPPHPFYHKIHQFQSEKLLFTLAFEHIKGTDRVWGVRKPRQKWSQNRMITIWLQINTTNMKSKLSKTRAFRLKRFIVRCSVISSAIIVVYHTENEY